MKAAFFTEHGPPEVMTYGDWDTPEPGPGEVAIDLKAIAMNRADLWMRQGLPGLRLELPHIPGGDGAGVIRAVGEGVTDFAVGDRVVINGTLSCGHCEFCLAGQDNLCRSGGVLGESRTGTYAEVIALSARSVMKLPDDFPFDDAAAASLVFLTAYHSLITKGRVEPGESVLIIGASGGANTAYLQLAKLVGATVYVVGSSDEKLERARELGADYTINRNAEDWSRAVYGLTGKRGADIVVDNVGQATLMNSMRAVARGGRILVVGNTSGYDVNIDTRYLFAKHISIIGSTMAPQADFRRVMGLVFAGAVQPVIDCVIPLSQAAEAHRVLEAGDDVFGKIILRP